MYMKEFMYWLQGEDRRTVSSHQQDSVSVPAAKEEEETAKSFVEAPKEAVTKAGNDIEILTEKYGELRSGLTIRLELNEACELLGRTRKRIDAFARLQKTLQEDYGVQLILYSRKTHNP
jgi:hypothetical protein